MRFPLRALLIGAAFAAIFSYISIVSVNRSGPNLPSTQISSLSILFCLLLVFLLNPLLRLLRRRVLSNRELILVFIMATVPAGLPAYGYVSEVLPIITSVNHPEWNNPQSRWDEDVVPFLPADLVLGAPLFQERDVRDWRAFHATLVKAGASQSPSPARQIWRFLPDDVQALVRQSAAGQDYTQEALEHAFQRVRERRQSREGLKTAPTLAAWEKDLAEQALRKENRDRIVRGIKHALMQRDFYNQEAFASIAIPPQAQRLLAQGVDKLSLDEVKHLNRWLLETAFPEAIKTSRFLSDQKVLRDLMLGMQARNREAWPIFVKKPEESFSQFGTRFCRYWTRTPQIDEDEIRNWWALPTLLSHADQPQAPRPLAHVWSLLSPDARTTIHGLAEAIAAVHARERDKKTSLSHAIKALASRPDLAKAKVFSSLRLPDDAQMLRNRGLDDLTKEETARLSLALLEAAFPQAHLTDWRAMSLVLAPPAGERSAQAAYVWKRLDPATQETVTLVVAADQDLEMAKPTILGALNTLVQKAKLYDTQVFLPGSLPEEAEAMVAGGAPASGEDLQVLNRLLLEASLPGCIDRYTMTFFGEVAWSNWMGPLVRWMGIGLVFFLLFYSLNELIFRQWHKNEQLVFPLAQLGATILETDEERGSLVPAVFRTPFFWVGFSIAFGVYAYNAMTKANWFPGLAPIDLRGSLVNHLRNTWLSGINPFYCEIYFTVIGLAFLLPTKISFSIWFFFIFVRFEQWIACWLGYGVDAWSFRGDWYSKAQFMSAQGGGAIQVFGLVYLWRVRHHILAFLYRLTRPNGTAQINKETIHEYTWPSLLFFAASAGVFGIMYAGGVSLGLAALTYFFLLLLTVAMVRLVAECGLISFQIFFGPLHVVRIFGLLKFPLLFAAKGIGMVLVLLQGLFLDMKVFIAPTMINAKYLATRQKISNRTFAFSIFLGIAITLTVSSAIIVIMASDQGLASMNRWFFKGLPQWSLRSAQGIMSDPYDMAVMDRSLTVWFCVGALMCGSLLYLRQFVFWLPHPIGLMLFSDTLAKFFWFSFFIAWLCKGAAVKYCDAEQYKSVRGFFIGLIVGAVLVVALAALIGLFYDPNMNFCLDPHRR